MSSTLRRVVPALVLLFAALPLFAARRVLYIDNSAPIGGDGTAARPFHTIGDAQARSGGGDILYVAQGSAPYEEGVSLRAGQILVGSRYGLDALRIDEKTDYDGPPTPAKDEPGPVIHGAIAVSGNNVVGGVIVAAEHGTAVVAGATQGRIAFRKLSLRLGGNAVGIFIGAAADPIVFTDGSIVSTSQGDAVQLNGGAADVTFERFTIDGSGGGGAVSILNRAGGNVSFRSGSRIRVEGAAKSGILLSASRGTYTFDDPLQIGTNGGRGFVVRQVEKVIARNANRIEARNGTALELFDSGGELAFRSVSAEGTEPGQLGTGIDADRFHGPLTITGDRGEAGSGGTIRNSGAYGIRIMQMQKVRMANLRIVGGGMTNGVAAEKCAGLLATVTNLECHAALQLGHVSDSTFESLLIDGGAQLGVNGNNLGGVTFDGLEVRNVGDESFEYGVYLQEVAGTVALRRCELHDNAAAQLVIDQRFNDGKVLLDRCRVSGLGAPGALQGVLVGARGNARARLEVSGSTIMNDAGAGVELVSDGSGAVSLQLSESTFQNNRGSAVKALAVGTSRIAVTADATRFDEGELTERAAIDLQAGRTPSDVASLCVDLGTRSMNFFSVAAPAAIRLGTHSAQAAIAVTGAAGTPDSAVAALATKNNGAVAVISGAVRSATGCD